MILQTTVLYALKEIRGVNVFGGSCTSWKEILCITAIAVGVVFFLYGANYFDALTGWAGVTLMLSGLIAELILKIFKNVGKKGGAS